MEAFDGLLRGPVSEYLSHSQAIGSEVQKHVSHVKCSEMMVNLMINLSPLQVPVMNKKAIIFFFCP